MIYCFCRVLVNGEENPYDGLFMKQNMWDVIRRDKNGGKSRFTCDFFPRRNYEWEERTVKIFQIIDRPRFYQCYVVPKLTGFLQDLNKNEDGVMSLLRYSELTIDITADYEIGGGSETISEELDLISYLGITGNLYDEICDGLGKKEIKYLSGCRNICQKNKNKTSILLYQADISVIKECGVYQILENILAKAEAVVRNGR